MTNIISDIVTGIENLPKEADALWNAVETKVNADMAAVEKAFPAAAPTVAALATAVKQGASDALGMGATVLGEAQAPIITGVNTGADAALLALTGGAATPAIPAFNGWIDGIMNTGIAALRSWALHQKALLAGSVTPAASAG